MIHLYAEVHDCTTLEFKISYETHEKLNKADFDLSMWFFVPENLEINEHSYSRESFYSNIKSRMRLISPRYKPEVLVAADALPYERLRKKLALYSHRPGNKALKEVKHEVCMVCNIARSALRDTAKKVEELSDEQQMQTQAVKLLHGALKIQTNYRACLSSLTLERSDAATLLSLGDEYLCGIIRSNLYRIADLMEERRWERPEQLLSGLLNLQEDMVKRNYPIPHRVDANQNSLYLHRSAQLKKFIESGLYITTHLRKGGYLLEQLMFMLSAGLAMSFALFINFSTRNFTDQYSLPIILLMIVSYMFKDRIKDWIRYWFHDKAGKAFFDKRTRLEMDDVIIGKSSQGVDYKQSEDLPPAINDLHHHSSGNSLNNFVHEDILLYRRGLHLDYKRLSRLSHHRLMGVTEILRMNLNPLMRWMDNPTITVHKSAEDSQIAKVPSQRSYFIDVVMLSSFLTQNDYTVYRIELNKSSILSVKQL